MPGRLLDLGVVPPLRSLAVFHAAARAMQGGDPPLLILVQPQTPFVSIGYHQEAEREVDLTECAALGMPVYRRQVGGGAVLLDRGQVFFHLILPETSAPRDIEERYRLYTQPALETYRSLGVPANFRPINDLEVSGRKIGGTGGATIGAAVVFVGSILLDFDARTMARVLKIPDEKMRDKVEQNLLEYVTCIRRERGDIPPVEEVKNLLVRHFAEVLDVPLLPDSLGEQEQHSLAEVERELASPEWLHLLRSPEIPWNLKISGRVRLRERVHKAPGGLLRATATIVEDRIGEILVTGDCTVEPQDALQNLPGYLEGEVLEEDALTRAVDRFFREQGVRIPGVQSSDLVTLLAGLKP